MLAIGLVYQSIWGAGLLFGLGGVGLAFVLHYALWSLKMEGAGDAKMMMAVGAFVGWNAMVEATVWRYMLLIPYALVILTVLGRWGNFRDAVRWTLFKAQGVTVGERPEATYMPFGPLLAISVPAALYTDVLDFF